MATPEDYKRFEINTSDYLGLNYQSYTDELYALAISKPSEYWQIRKKVLESVKRDTIADLYKTFSLLLSQGKAKDGSDLGLPSAPNYPQQLISDEALSACKTMDSILNHIVSIILPADFKTLAQDNLIRKANQEA